ncbi:MAG: beta-lactamase family protein [Cytophagales bacterium]|nr:beta-lactamase family protein [Armatimonadota bacterium]
MQKNAAEKIGALVRGYHSRGAFDGVVLAGQNGEVVYQSAVGMADRKRGIPHVLEAPFPICSVTKQFTALLVMQQVAAGRFMLEGKISEYLPGFRSDTGSRITLKHLMTHTSGLANTDDIPDFYTSRDPRLIRADYVVKTYCQKPLTTPPGAKFRYNNADYLVLAAILEKTLGRPYEALLAERILRPLGMTRSGILGSQSSQSQVVGYERKGKVLAEEQPRYRLANYGAAGAMYSTVGDLLKWDRALQTDQLLPRAVRDLMFKSDPSKGYVACGSWVYGYIPYGGKVPTLVERQGGIGALHAQNLQALDDRISVILLSNRDTVDLTAYTGKGLTCDILRVLYETA